MPSKQCHLENPSLLRYMIGYAAIISCLFSLNAYLVKSFNFSLSYFSLIITFIASFLISEIYYRNNHLRLHNSQIKRLAIGGNVALIVFLPVIFGILWLTYYSQEEKQLYIDTFQKSMWLILIGIGLFISLIFNTGVTIFALTIYNAENSKKINMTSRERFLMGLMIAILVIILLWGFLHFTTPLFDSYSK